ncbi:putative tim-barrel enzyme family protein [Rosellinia necatrix]|uniref:Putative tim-barrel enzyme family protein n=1 Tax=Rosellinia necatrix TaxID=77044 RepID=A0A1S7ULP2_ROSNE|nr:putative tim-barrel enzyme family protein [Rosellinia necatrix]
MAPIPRAELLARFRGAIAARRAIVGAGAGIGLSAKSAEAGGADLIIVYNSGRFRMAGRGSLAGMMPYGDANGIVAEMAREVLPVVARAPVLAGVCGTDPFRDMAAFLRQLRDLGFSGVQNFPTVGLVDGGFRAGLEETGMGYGLEVEMVRLAAAMDLLTAPYVFTPAEAVAMTRAGADIVVAHMGLTTGAGVGGKTGKTLDECVARVQEIRDAAAGVREDVIVLCHGGPIAEVEHAEYVLSRTRGVHGFFGASSMERIPVEIAIAENTRRFKDIRIGG